MAFRYLDAAVDAGKVSVDAFGDGVDMRLMSGRSFQAVDLDPKFAKAWGRLGVAFQVSLSIYPSYPVYPSCISITDGSN